MMSHAGLPFLTHSCWPAQDIIRNVPFFRDANDLFIDELLAYLRAEVCLPGDYIIREGDTGYVCVRTTPICARSHASRAHASRCHHL